MHCRLWFWNPRWSPLSHLGLPGRCLTLHRTDARCAILLRIRQRGGYLRALLGHLWSVAGNRGQLAGNCLLHLSAHPYCWPDDGIVRVLPRGSAPRKAQRDCKWTRSTQRGASRCRGCPEWRASRCGRQRGGPSKRGEGVEGDDDGGDAAGCAGDGGGEDADDEDGGGARGDEG